jgi:hypothetical protein
MNRSAALFLLFVAATARAGEPRWDRFPFGTRYEPIPPESSRHLSRTFVLILTGDEAKDVRIPTSGDSPLTVWALPIAPGSPEKELTLTVTDDAGRPIDPSSMNMKKIPPGVTPELGLELTENSPQLVVWLPPSSSPYRLKLNLPPPIRGAVLLVAEPASSVTLSTWAAPLARLPGQNESLLAELKNGEAPIREATVTAYLTAPDQEIESKEIALSDNGANGDAVKDDGIYTADLPDLPPTPGLWSVRIEARGPGDRFARTSSAGFVTDAATAPLSGESAVLTNDSLNVFVTPNVKKSGKYRLDLTVADAKLRTSLAWAEQTFDLKEGSQSLAIAIPRKLIEGAATDLIVDIRLLSYDPPSIAGRSVVPVTELPPVDAAASPACSENPPPGRRSSSSGS